MTSLPCPPRQLLRLQLRTLHRLDARGRLLASNEPGAERGAPRIFIGSAEGERIIRVRWDIPETRARQWLACNSDAELVSRVAEHAPIENEYRGPAFLLPPLDAPAEGVVSVTSAGQLHPELLGRGWRAEETAPYVGVIRDGLVVAACYSSRLGDDAAEAGLETAPGYRGQGLGAEATRAWAAAVQSTGRLAFYSTSWDNLASRRIAEKLGAIEFAENWHLT